MQMWPEVRPESETELTPPTTTALPLKAMPTISEVRSRIASAAPSALLLTTAHLLNDLSVLRPEWKPDPGALPRGNYSSEVADQIREYCIERLSQLEAGAPVQLQRPSAELHAAAASWVVGIEDAQELEMLSEALVFDGEDLNAPTWTIDDIAPGRYFPVAIIGSGLSGLLQALRLKQAGIPFVIYEKGSGVGGTWFENHYPDCRTDVASHIYMYSFEAYDWPAYFGRQEAILEFLRNFAAKHDLLRHIQLDTEVLAARWDVQRAAWAVRSRHEGVEREDSFTALISAVGQLNRPNVPKIPGAESFQGAQFHSAEWDHSVPLEGKRIVVIGTGASALQFGPAVARIAEHVTIIQRTPPWLIKTPELRADIPDDERWLFAHLPTYRAWYRYSIFLPRVHGQLDAAIVDLDYPPTERAISAASEEMRQKLSAYLEEQIGSSHELRDKVLPTYPPGAKRVIRDDGTWIQTLKRQNVSTVMGGVREIRPDGVVAENGDFIPCDVILYGTGFKATDFLMPMSIQGIGGEDLHKHWDGDAAAFLGVTVPNFPNFFLLYGPNTGVVVHGNLVFFTEAQVSYVMSGLHALLASGATSINLVQKVFEDYQNAVDQANSLRVWGWSGVNSWYKNAHGRSPIMWPFSTLDYWQRTREIDLNHYKLGGVSPLSTSLATPRVHTA